MNFIKLAALAIGAFMVTAAAAPENTLNWSATRPLTWKDFTVRATLPTTEPAKAWTACNFGFTWRTSGNQLIISVVNVFDKSKSWVKKGSESDYLLAHEQGHFDITEINSRQFKQELQAYKFKRSTLQKDLDALFNKHYAACRKQQELYDSETEHSLKTEPQKKWAVSINERLNSLTNFTVSDITVPLIN